MNQWEWAGPKLYTSNGWGLQLRCFPRLGSVICWVASGEFVQVARDCEEKGGYFVGSLRGEESHEKSVVVENAHLETNSEFAWENRPNSPQNEGIVFQPSIVYKVLRLMEEILALPGMYKTW